MEREREPSVMNGRVQANVPADRSLHGTTEQRRLLMWPFLSFFFVFSSLNAREALINFDFNLTGTLSQLTVALISVWPTAAMLSDLSGSASKDAQSKC